MASRLARPKMGDGAIVGGGGFGLSRGNGLAANVGGGATVGSSRCGSTGRATARTSRREQFFEKRNASTLDLNHF